jgi:hypothetical protein
MGLAAQQIQYVLPSVTWSAGTSGTQTLRDLPKQYLGRLCHLWKLTFGIVMTPTFTTAPTTVGHNNLFSTVDFWDGSIYRFQGGLNHMRAKERLSAGRVRIPDGDVAASGSARHFRRVLHVGPPHLAASPSDWIIPTGMLENGELRYKHGALTDISADTTANTATMRVAAALILMDEIRIPPAYQFTNQAVSAGDVGISGRALYESISIIRNSSFGNFAALDIQDVRVDLGSGDVVPTVRASDLQAAFQDDFNAGEIGPFQGDVEHATLDATGKQVVRTPIGSANTLGAGAIDLQAVLWTPPDGRLSKMFLAESIVRMRWNGAANSTGPQVITGRILPQVPSVAAQLGAKALGRLGRSPKSVLPKTLSKKGYAGPYLEFFPWQVKV